MRALAILLGVAVLAGCRTPLRPAWEPADPDLRCYCRQRANKKSMLLAGGGLAATAAYGLASWDYGTSDFHFADEGWFSEHTEFGGADKAGHFITAYILTAAAAAPHRSWGYTRREAALRGALTSMLWMTAIEIGDGTAEPYGFSWGDMALNLSYRSRSSLFSFSGRRCQRFSGSSARGSCEWKEGQAGVPPDAIRSCNRKRQRAPARRIPLRPRSRRLITCSPRC